MSVDKTESLNVRGVTRCGNYVVGLDGHVSPVCGLEAEPNPIVADFSGNQSLTENCRDPACEPGLKVPRRGRT